jgi:HK97 family phage major capsid protein
MSRLQEIETRLAAIKTELETRSADLTTEQLTAFETEVNALKEERKALQTANEQRAGLLSSIAANNAAGTITHTFPSPNEQKSAPANADGDPLARMEYRKAFMANVLRNVPIPAEFRADAITQTTDIGVLIPQTVLNTIVEKITASGMILPLVTRTAYKGGLTIPTSSVKPVATWVAEGAGSEKQKKTTGSITFVYNKLRCAVAMTLEVDTMAMSAFESTLINNVVEAMTIALEQSIISGSGSGQPKGILTETPVSGQALTVVAPSYADLISAEAALPIEYENGAVWCMTKKTFMAYFGLLDSAGQPIGRVNYGITGRPERTLLGRNVVITNYIDSFSPSLATSKVFAFLFNFSDYILNTNYQMGMKRYEDNDTDDQITKAVMLVDGKVVVKESLVTLKRVAA